MISIKDLMRGNLIATPTGIKTVAGFVPGKEVAAIYFEDGSHVGNHMCAPVPLSIEWLERFGFKTMDYELDVIEWATQDTEKLFCITQSGIPVEMQPFTFDYEIGYGEEIEVEVKYVHQLQNLFAALTGTELEIKLP